LDALTAVFLGALKLHGSRVEFTMRKAVESEIREVASAPK